MNPVDYLDAGTDAFIAVSRACADAWIRRGISANKMHVIYNGIDVNNFSEKCRHRRICGGNRNSDLNMLFLGGCVEAKGVFDVVGAIAKLMPKYAGRVHLDIFGFDNPSTRRTVEKIIQRNRLGDAIVLRGTFADPTEVLPYYDVGLVCSRGEAFGRVVIEYWAAGLAVIGANTGAIPELLDGGERGILYDKKSGAASLAAAIELLLNNHEAMIRLKNCGMGFASRFDVRGTVASIGGGSMILFLSPEAVRLKHESSDSL